MAFSASEGKEFFKDWLVHFAKPLGFKTFLDIGCGAGGYGKLIRSVFESAAILDAVDIFPEYIERHGLKQIYDSIIVGDVRDLHPSLKPHDLVIMGDILEHLEKPEAIVVVASLKQKCRFLWAALPVKMGRSWSTGYLQGPDDYQENPFNRHLWDWTAQEIQESFQPLWIVPYIQTGSFLMEGGIQ